jgi:hypothetical protein
VIVATMRERSDHPEKLKVFFLHPRLEGLLQAIQACEPTLLPHNLRRALKKQLIDRDIVFNEVKKAGHRSLRDCVRKAQPGLHALATAIAACVPR